MRRVKYTFYIIIAVFFALAQGLSAQNRQVDSLVRLGESLHMDYRFDEACQAFEEAAGLLGDNVADSLIMESVAEKLILSENGLSMADFAYTPAVVDRTRFSIDDFFLYYPLRDRSWRKVPDQLDSSSFHPFSKALFAPSGSDRIIFSAEDAAGIRNLFMTEIQDTLWTYPSMLNESLTSFSDEIYPMLSSDGKSLYFSSDGLYGVGGYDLYVSRWDDEMKDWSEPVNMGFPYSSPYDDFLYLSDDEEGYVFFASNRDCQGDSVWVYVLEYDSMPVRHSVEDPAALKELSLLIPEHEQVREEEPEDAGVSESAGMEKYRNKMAHVRQLRDSVAFYTSSLEEDRSLFALSNDDSERMRLADIIRKRESYVPELQDSLKKAISQLQEIEMEFLSSGVVVDPDKIMAAATNENEDAPRYDFVKRSFGGPLDLHIMKPEKEFDYSFMVLDEGRFAEDNTIPNGIIYQIQIFSAGGKADVKSLKGLSPVFERRGESGRYTYRVGLFNSYKDVLSKLNTVKGRGFRSAFIVAYDDGEEISVATARNRETAKDDVRHMYEVRIIPVDGVLEDTVTAGIRQQAAGKDIARSEAEDGTIIFMVGPFTDKAQADDLAAAVMEMGISDVSVHEVANDSVNQ
ncbi:MAG: PD40 domain-containing protein [Bacteroidales bacterium]|nr:PD40 domain-containing protein [Bacteroidales bacterium]